MATSGKDVTRSPCTPDDLFQIAASEGSGMILMPSRAYDEVHPNIYVSERSFAMDKEALKRVGITHVLNAAQGVGFGHVNTDEDYYKDTGIKFFAIKASDLNKFNISPFLNSTSAFIEDALQNQGRVLVHCVEGFSRSATLVIAFLMVKRDMDVREALRTVRSKREVCPNDGFMKQLCELNARLIEESKS